MNYMFVPMKSWMYDCLDIHENIKIHVDPSDNSRYTIVDYCEERPIYHTTTSSGKLIYEPNIYQKYTGLETSFTNKNNYTTVKKKSSDRVVPFKSLKYSNDNDTYFENNSKKKNPCTRYTFISIFPKANPKLIGKIYDFLKDYDIDDQVIDVVNSALKCVYSKSL